VFAGLPVGLVGKKYAENETGNPIVALLFPIGVGAGVGIGLDALFAPSRTVFERTLSMRAQVSAAIVPGVMPLAWRSASGDVPRTVEIEAAAPSLLVVDEW
jgi:hypothetical protein